MTKKFSLNLKSKCEYTLLIYQTKNCLNKLFNKKYFEYNLKYKLILLKYKTKEKNWIVRMNLLHQVLIQKSVRLGFKDIYF